MKKVGIIMGSDSDLPIMQQAAEFLKHIGVAYEITIVSAHRTPDRLYNYAKTAKDRGIGVIIAGAGGAAHLPGMTASLTALPVIGVPIETMAYNGHDSLLSIVQMPAGIPVATMAINGARNAGIYAAAILAVFDEDLYATLELYKQELREMVEEKAAKLEKIGFEGY
jgi:5-(carboxyamino)imidazole ribonucleotide mutase